MTNSPEATTPDSSPDSTTTDTARDSAQYLMGLRPKPPAC